MMNQLPTHILNHLLNNEDYCRRVVPYLKKDYFEGDHRTVFDLIVKFVSTHNKLNVSPISNFLSCITAQKIIFYYTAL